MPIYGYRCTACGHQFEILQKMSDAAIRECPVCEQPVRKLVYPAGIIYKGSGYYSTDYRSSSGGPASNGKAESPAPAAGAPESGAEPKAESTTPGADG